MSDSKADNNVMHAKPVLRVVKANITPNQFAWENNGMTKFDKLWIELSRAHDHAVKSGVAELKDITMPWGHPEPDVREAWKSITEPANLHLLEQRLAKNLNPSARRVTAEAKRQCEERARKRTESQNKGKGSND